GVSSSPPPIAAFPVSKAGRLPHQHFQGLLSVHYSLQPVGSRGHLRDPFHRRLQPFRHLHDCSDCYRLERKLPGGSVSHWVIAPFHGALRGLLGDSLHVAASRLAESPTCPFPSKASAVSFPPRLPRLLPAGAKVAGWVCLPLGDRAFPRRTERRAFFRVLGQRDEPLGRNQFQFLAHWFVYQHVGLHRVGSA